MYFVKVHLSTFRASRDAVFLTEEDPQGRNVWQTEESVADRRIGKNCVSRRSKSRKMNLYKDKFDAVRRNPYSNTLCTYTEQVPITVE